MFFKSFLKAFFIFVFVTVLVFTEVVYKANAQQVNDLSFYEGNGCTQGLVFSYNSYVSANDNCKKRGACKGDNDEARSLFIPKTAKPGSQIEVYDDPGGSTQDDYAVIRLINPQRFGENGLCVSSFQERLDNKTDGATLEYHANNGLDGKVSRVVVRPN